MAFDIVIRPASSVPIFRQIVEQVCAAVVGGRIADDEPLPSVRALAEHLVINPNTVARAYSELARDGLIESRQGRGMFVSTRREIYSRDERARRIEQSVNALITQAFVLGLTTDEIIEQVAKRAREIDPGSRSKSAGRPGKHITQRETR
jgi:GntR family transcriptional regulator